DAHAAPVHALLELRLAAVPHALVEPARALAAAAVARRARHDQHAARAAAQHCLDRRRVHVARAGQREERRAAERRIALCGAPLAPDDDDVAWTGPLALDERAHRGELVTARAADRADRHRRARADADAAAHAAGRI